MVDNTGTTRLEWRSWDIFTKLPVGMVAYTEEHQFVARVKRGSSFRDVLKFCLEIRSGHNKVHCSSLMFYKGDISAG